MMKDQRRNFTSEEDVLLTRAYVSCTMDSRKGTEQKKDQFWSQISEKFESLKSAGGEVVPIEKRTQEALMNRFNRTIQKECLSWIAILRNTPKESGDHSDEEHYDKVSQKYTNLKGKSFKFLNCVTHLFILPKFDPNSSNSDSDSSYNNVTTKLERPLGCKKSKIAYRTKNELADHICKLNETMEGNAKVLRKSHALQALNAERKYLMEMYKICKDTGNDLLANEYFQKLRDTEVSESSHDCNNSDSDSIEEESESYQL